MICFKLIYIVYLILWCTHTCSDFIYICIHVDGCVPRDACGILCYSCFWKLHWDACDVLILPVGVEIGIWQLGWPAGLSPGDVTNPSIPVILWLVVKVAHGVEPLEHFEPLQSKMILRLTWHDDILLCLSYVYMYRIWLDYAIFNIISDCFRILINLLSFISSYPCSCVFTDTRAGGGPSQWGHTAT